MKPRKFRGDQSDTLRPILKRLGIYEEFELCRKGFEEEFTLDACKQPKLKAYSVAAHDFAMRFPGVRKSFREQYGVATLHYRFAKPIELGPPLDEDQTVPDVPEHETCDVAMRLEEVVHPSRWMDPADKPIDRVAAMEWAKAHLLTPSAMLKPEMCPNAFAWAMLIEARKDRGKFIKEICKGMQATQSQEESEKKVSTNENILDALDRIQACLN